MMVTVVQVRAACELDQLDQGQVIVTAVTRDRTPQKVEWRTSERPQIGDRFTVQVEALP